MSKSRADIVYEIQSLMTTAMEMAEANGVYIETERMGERLWLSGIEVGRSIKVDGQVLGYPSQGVKIKLTKVDTPSPDMA